MQIQLVDALGRQVVLSAPARRVVSLVPSETHSVFQLGRGDALVGRTDYCIHPAAPLASVPSVGGTKTPRVEQIVGLRPDLVLANREENRRKHVEALEEAGLTVFVSHPSRPADSARYLRDLGALLGEAAQAEALAAEIEAALEAPLRSPRKSARRPRALYFIWREPWMVTAPDTYIHQMLAAAGFEVICPEGAARYPTLEEGDIAASGADVVLLPSEPFHFQQEHVEEFTRRWPALPATARGQIHLLPGEHASWYGAWCREGLPFLARLRMECERHLL